MPVKCKLVDGKYRILEPGGGVAKNNAGTALDGGGHNTMSKCRAQASAINVNIQGAKTVFNCECIKCGYAIKTQQHCAELKCPKCGGQMRRAERPGPGQESSKLLKNIQNEHTGWNMSTLLCGKFITLGDGEKDGLPTKRFAKDMIKVGVYEHPTLGWKADVTPERLKLWLGAFKRMNQDGIDVPITVDHSRAAGDVQGYVIDMYIDGDALFGVHEFIGKDSIELAQKCKNVSVGIDKDYIDGNGTYYGEAIVHSSLVQEPIITGQEPFEAIAASRKLSLGLPTLVLNSDAKSTGLDLSKEHAMDPTEILTKIREMLGSGDDLTEENMLTRISERLEAQLKEKQELEKRLTELEGEVAAASKNASKTEESPKIDEETQDLLAEGIHDKVDALVTAGRISPAAAAEMIPVLCGTQGKRNVFCLSRKMSGTNESVARGIINALSKNSIQEMAEKTGHQVVELARVTPGGSDDEQKGADETAQSMTENINRGRKDEQ